MGVAAVATYVRHTSDATRQIASAKRQVAGNCNCQRKQKRGRRGRQRNRRRIEQAKQRKRIRRRGGAATRQNSEHKRCLQLN